MKGLSTELASFNIHFNVETGFERNGEFGSLLKEEWDRLVEACQKLAACEQKIMADEDVHKSHNLDCFDEDVL